MLEILTLEVIAFIVVGVLGLTFIKVKKAILRRRVLTTSMYSLSANKVYYFEYIHGFLFKRSFKLDLENKDDKTYIIKETVYYNFDTDISISVFKNSVVVYTVELRNVVFQESYEIGEIK